MNHCRERRAAYLFESNRLKPFSTRRIRQIIELIHQYASEAGIEKRVYPHLFRHQIITYLTRKGIISPKLQLLAGTPRRRVSQFTGISPSVTSLPITKPHADLPRQVGGPVRSNRSFPCPTPSSQASSRARFERSLIVVKPFSISPRVTTLMSKSPNLWAATQFCTLGSMRGLVNSETTLVSRRRPRSLQIDRPAHRPIAGDLGPEIKSDCHGGGSFSFHSSGYRTTCDVLGRIMPVHTASFGRPGTSIYPH
jgi:hypothetical protein